MKTLIIYRKISLLFSITFLFFFFSTIIIPAFSIAAEITTTSSAEKTAEKETPESAETKPSEKAEPKELSLPPVELTTKAIQERINTVNGMSELSAESKKKIVDYYNLALKSLERQRNAVSQARKYSELMKEDTSSSQNNSNMLMIRPIAIERKARSMALTDIETRIAELQAQLGLEQTNLELAKQVQQKTLNKPAELRKDITFYEDELKKLQAQLDNPKKNDNLTPREIRAKRTSTRAKCAALIAELKVAEKTAEIAKLNTSQVNDKLAMMSRKVDRFEKLIKTWGDIKEVRRTDIGFTELRQNNASLAQLNNKTYPNIDLAPLQELAKRNIEISKEIISITRQDNEAEKSLDILKARQKLLEEDFSITSRRIQLMGLTKKSGEILLAKRTVLLTSRAYPEIVKNRSNDILNANLKSDDLLHESQNFLPYKNKIYQGLDDLDGKKYPEQEINSLTTTAFVLVESYRKLLADAGKNYTAFISTLNNQTVTQKKINSLSQEFRDYINQRLLWTSSSDIYSFNNLTGSYVAVLWFINSSNWQIFIKDFNISFTQHPLIWVLFIIAFAVSVILQFQLPKQIAKINIYASKPKQDTAGRSISVVALGILKAICIPSTIFLASLYFSNMANINIFTKAICVGIYRTISLVIMFNIIIYFSKENGIGITNFDWSKKICATFRKDLKLFLYIIVPLVFLVVTFQNGPLNIDLRGTLGRTLAIVVFAIVLIFILQTLKKIKNIKVNSKYSEWIKKHYLWARILPTAILLALIILAFAGYYFTVFEFTKNISLTIYYLIAFLLLKEILHRIIYLSQIHIAYMKAQAKKEEERERKILEKQKQGLDASESLDIEIVDIVINEEELNNQTFQLINFILFIVVIAGIVLIWSDTFPSIAFLNNVVIWSSATTVIKGTVPVMQKISLLNLLQTLFIFLCTVIVVKNLSAIIELIFFRGRQAHPGSRHALTLISKYIVTCIGFFLGLKFIGIGWAQFQYMAAAMTVGLSFGLKDIFANFVSGIIILLERPIRMGDIVSVGQASGTVTKIQIRSTTITQWDRHELIVPNMCFLSEKIVNWSLSNDIMRVVISVGITHDSNAKEAEKILLQIAQECPLTLETPAPSVVFVDFDTNSYKFALRVFVVIDNMMTAQHKIRHDIINRFKKAGIVIPHAEHNIHFSSEEISAKVKKMNNTV